VTCCAGKHGLEVCALCAEFPCKKYNDRQKIDRDSFVTHKRMFSNHDKIRATGLDEFLSDQKKRIFILEDMLANFDDGRSKSFFCLAAALLSIESLNAALAEASSDHDAKSKTKVFRLALTRRAEIEGVELALKK